MKHSILLFILLITVAACGPLATIDNHRTPAELGWGCTYSEFKIKNKTDEVIKITIDDEVIDVQKGKRFKRQVEKGQHRLCVEDVCENFSFYPCMSYDFTASLY